ncbi:hypothetical protein LTR99_004698 [Exophiala xenobiotica]|uniref:Nuclear transport factor 2 n=1 Tax=Vermiconidia calcicola TaxID=1690605 RepID=A0AAV9QE74_9PEZI|nr:hypothetical protein LTR99_004698 [Exophiala xenobiotica]KAK5338851.1 hypothetical protein LTR98_005251 [Exophiala xenobiotica]KAK5432935.1 hypothetical protein LTR34_004408 [Exophiala xenobiotica]KAK5531685.1 hypothetical protein LTR23_009801 [Chaetothyriales sp. CCFEE 6169]KAK5539979.1 hypothetical protein LTR25_003684 [Vermiconidia calcicola]
MHRRTLSYINNTKHARPPMYRSATEPAECIPMMSPVSNAPHSRSNSVMPSPTISKAQLSVPTKTHSRSTSASSIDSNVLNRFGYPTYRQLPVYMAHNQQTPSPDLFATNYMPYTNIAMPEPPMINLEGTFDLPIDLDCISRPCSMSPPPMLAPTSTASMLSYLTQPTQPINLVRHLTYQTGRGLTNHFWWDVRNVRPWKSFSLQTMATIPDLLTLLNFQHDTSCLPFTNTNTNTVTPASEMDLANLVSKIYFPKVNAATRLSLGNNSVCLYPAPAATGSGVSSNAANIPNFLANYPSDNDRTLSGLPRGRVVGLVRSFDRWNTGMRREGPARKVEYLRTLAHLQKCMRDHSCRYGFIITEIELVCVRAGCDDRDQPYFGFLEVAEAVETKTFAGKEGNLTGSGNVTMTVTLALYYLLMLAKATPLPGQPGSYMDVGGSGTLSRQRVWDGGNGTGDGTITIDEDGDVEELGKDGKDKWIPEPQMGEKREARTVRGWVWPSDPWHKREGEREQFVDFYYKTFDTDRAQLAALYRPNSMLTFEKEPFQGTQSILEKLTNLPFNKVQHRVDTTDAQPSNEQGGILVLVTGALMVDDQQQPMSYVQTFNLLSEGGSYYVFNDVFRLVYAAG